MTAHLSRISHLRRGVVGAAAAILAAGALGACSSGSDSPATTDAASPSTAATAPATTDAATPDDDSTTASGASDAGGAPAAAPAAGDREVFTEMPGEDIDLRAQAFPVAPEQAIQTATDTAGAGTVHSIELDHSDDRNLWYYEVSVLIGGTDHEVEIDAMTGAVIDHDQESTDDHEEAIDLASPMTFDDAMERALTVRDGEVRGWKLEWDDERREYQFDIDVNGDEDEVTVLVETGEAFED